MQLHYDYELSKSMVLNLALHYTRGLGFFENYLGAQDLTNYTIPDTTNQLYDLVTRRWLSNHFYGVSYSLQHQSANRRSKLILNGAVNQYDGFHYGQVVWNDRDYINLDSLFAGRTSPVSYYENDASKSEINHFLKWDYRLTDDLNAYADFQYRFVQYSIDGSLRDQRQINVSEKYHFFNPKFGLSYQYHQYLNTYFSYAIANREPNRNDFTSFSTEGLAKPERLHNFELGARYNTKKTYLAVNLYYMLYNDQLVLTGRINDVGEYIRENVEQSFRRGLEISVRKNYKEKLDWNANLNLSQNRIGKYIFYRDDWDSGGQLEEVIENTNLSFSPNVIISNQLNYVPYSHEKFDQKIEISLRTKYVGAQYLDNSSSAFAKLDPYLNNDLAFNYAFKPKFTQGISIQFTIYNLLNAKYISNGWIYRFNSEIYNPIPDDPYAVQEEAGQYNLTGYFPQAERHYMLALSMNF
jgi:iron complex outermembrane receptor protein